MLYFNYCDLLAHISYGSVLLFAMGLLNLENGALFVAAALRTSKGVYALMFWSVSSTLKFIVGCNRWDPLQFFRVTNVCQRTLESFAFLLCLSELALRFVMSSESSFSVWISF